jgi:HEAT repeat protein
MSTSVWVAALAFVAALSSSKEAVEAIASGSEDASEAVAYLRARGRPGLWSAHAAAKRESGDRRVRLLASLGALPFEGAEWALRDAYRQGDATSRLGATLGLGKLPGPGPRRVLLEAARADEVEIRSAAALGLARQIDRVRPEVAAMLYEPGTAPKLVALEVAIASEDEALAEQAIPVGLGAEDRDLRIAALKLVAATGSTLEIDRVRQLATSAEVDVARTALRALETTGHPERHRWIGRVLANSDASDTTRDAAFGLLANSGPAGFGPLVEALAQSPDAETRIRRGLERPVPDEQVARWVDALDSADPRWRRVAELALQIIGAPANRRLIAKLADPDRQAADRALTFLLTVAGDDLDSELERASRADDPALRAGAVAARIRRTGDRGAERYASALDAEEAVVRTAAARALAAVGQDRADAIVLERAGTDGPTDIAFLKGVQERPAGEMRRRLALRLLESSDPNVRRRAIEVLTPVEDEQSLDALVAHLRGAPLDEKYEIMEAVASSRLPRAANTMIDLVTHVDPQIRQVAQRYVSER